MADEEKKDVRDVWNELTYDQRLAATAVIFETLCEHARRDGTFRYLIYERLGFGPDAYSLLLGAGGMDISNEFKLPTRAEQFKQAMDYLGLKEGENGEIIREKKEVDNGDIQKG